MSVQHLPTLNAALNTLCTALLLAGLAAIRRKNVRLHKRCMIGAFLVSCAFLTSYVIYHVQVGHRPFAGTGWVRPVYFTLLFSHILLAFVEVPLVLTTLILALRERFEAHRRIAPWTFGIWLYVSVTGVVVYLMLYHLFR